MSEICTACGNAALTERVASFFFSHGGKQASIDDTQTVCEVCGSVSYAGEQISRHELAVAAKIREMDGLLSADDLRCIRLKYAFRQTDLEAMLSVGPKTWTRWERGKVPQSKAADTLIRVLADDPEVARRLMLQSGIENPAADRVFEQIDEDMKRQATANLQAQIGSSWSRDMSVGDVASRAIDAVRAARRENAAKAA
nr:type II TA system antitoxin MqsA family protein [uncultured Rhodopila sp.]